MTEYGLFDDEAANWTEAEAVEAGFYSEEEAEKALRTRYSEEDELQIHEIEQEDDEDEDEEDDSEQEDDDGDE